MNLNEVKPGDRLVFKGGGFLFQVIGGALKLFQKDWDKWGWHMATVCWYDDAKNDLFITEAVLPRVRTVRLLEFYPRTTVRVYRWLDAPPEDAKIKAFVFDHEGASYDPWVYLWTVTAEIAYRIRKWVLPRILDSSYSCWEYADEFDIYMGKPWPSSATRVHRYPLLTEFLEAKPTFIGEIDIRRPQSSTPVSRGQTSSTGSS